MLDEMIRRIDRETRKGLSRRGEKDVYDRAPVVGKAVRSAIARTGSIYHPRQQAKTLSGWSGRSFRGPASSLFRVEGVTVGFDGSTRTTTFTVTVTQRNPVELMQPVDLKALGPV